MAEVSVLVLGDEQVGKSQLLYGEPGLVQAYNATFRTKKLYLFAEHIYFRLFSLSGKWNVQQLPQAYLQKKYDIIYIMFDLTNRASFEKVTSYIKAVKRINKKATFLMIATKHDDREHRLVTDREIKRATRKFNCECIQTSAINKKNLHELFVKTREIVFEKRAQEKARREATFLKRYYKEIVLFAIVAGLIGILFIVAMSFVPGLGPLIAVALVSIPLLSSLPMFSMLQSTMVVLGFSIFGGIAATLIFLAKEVIQRYRKAREGDAPAVKLSTTGQLAQEAGFVPGNQPDLDAPSVDERIVDGAEKGELKPASPSLQYAYVALKRTNSK